MGTVGTPTAVFLHGLMGLKIFSIFYAELLFSSLPEHQTTQKRKLAASPQPTPPLPLVGRKCLVR